MREDIKVLETLNNVSDDANESIQFEEPYVVRVKITGSAAMLFHRWSVEEVEAKGKAAKGSKAKKTDNVETYVYRNQDGEICVPGEYLRMSIIGAAKFLQDPRSPRKSAQDLFKAGVIVLTELASLGTDDWDYLDRRRVRVQQAGITRTRPGFNIGWQAEFHIQCLLPEYINPEMLNDTIAKAGRLVGLGDFRPSHGRFQVVLFELEDGQGEVH